MRREPDRQRTESERVHWAGRGEAWDRWADDLAKVAPRFNAPLIEAASIDRGDRVLDLASGAGEPALTIAGLLGRDGRITASDFSLEMLAGSRRRAEAAGLGNLDFSIADMQALPFADESFDVVTCRFGIMFVPDPDAAIAEAHRVLRGGGRAAFLVWGPLSDITMFRVLDQVSQTYLDEPMSRRALTPFRFGEPRALMAAMTKAGFVDIAEDEIRFTGDAPADIPFWRANLEMSYGTALDALDPDARRAMEAEIRQAFQAYRADDKIKLDVHIRIYSARRA